MSTSKVVTRRFGFLCSALLLLFMASEARAQESLGKPAAKAEFEKGEAARAKGEYSEAVPFFRRAIELDPDYVEAHFQFMRASIQAGKKDLDAATRDLQELYEGWAKKSNNALYQWALGYLNYKTPGKSEAYYKKAIELDPTFARAYYELAQLAEYRGQNRASLEYYKKAVECNSGNADYLLSYAYSLRKTDSAGARKLLMDLVSRSPNDDMGAQALSQLGAYTENPEEKTALLERLKASYPPVRFPSSASGMWRLLEVYARTDAAKALALAREMSDIAPDPQKKNWKGAANFQQSFIEGRKLLGEKKFSDALKLLENTPKPFFMNDNAVTLMKAEAEDELNSTDKAYERIAKSMLARPSEALRAALFKYGAKLNKTARQVDDELWRLKQEKAVAAEEFALSKYSDKKMVKLSDYRGQVVLVNFFFPG